MEHFQRLELHVKKVLSLPGFLWAHPFLSVIPACPESFPKKDAGQASMTSTQKPEEPKFLIAIYVL